MLTESDVNLDLFRAIHNFLEFYKDKSHLMPNPKAHIVNFMINPEYSDYVAMLKSALNEQEEIALIDDLEICIDTYLAIKKHCEANQPVQASKPMQDEQSSDGDIPF